MASKITMAQARTVANSGKGSLVHGLVARQACTIKDAYCGTITVTPYIEHGRKDTVTVRNGDQYVTVALWCEAPRIAYYVIRTSQGISVRDSIGAVMDVVRAYAGTYTARKATWKYGPCGNTADYMTRATAIEVDSADEAAYAAFCEALGA